MPNPYISVLMTVYNGERYLRDAIESILNQTFRDYEFIIVDDGSTDGSPAILAEYAALDPRIVLVHNEENMGHSISANRGLKLARGEYVARMDADDISLRDRFARQVAFMDAHPQIGVCGTWSQYFGAINQIWRAPQDDAEIKCYLFFDSPVANPTSMIRRRIIVDHGLAYRSEYIAAEDYAFWADAAQFTSFANLPEVLLRYRTHATQSTSTRRAAMTAGADKVRLEQLVRLGIIATEEAAKLHLQIIKLEKPLTRAFVTQADAWIQKLQATNRQVNVFAEPAFSEKLASQWFVLCRRSAPTLGLFSWRSFRQSPLSRHVNIDRLTKLKFFMTSAFPWTRGLRRRFIRR